jgi:hypothetical protein
MRFFSSGVNFESTQSLTLYLSSRPIPIFIRANSHLIDQHPGIFAEKDLAKNQKLLENLWLTEFKGKLIFNQTLMMWDSIEFDNDQDKTMFLIKWG